MSLSETLQTLRGDLGIENLKGFFHTKFEPLGVPDYGADRAAGKRRLVVKLGCRGALALAAFAVVLAALLALWVRHGQAVQHLAGLDLLASLHAGVLLWLMWRQRERVAKGERIDGLMAASLLYIVRFAAVPLFHLS